MCDLYRVADGMILAHLISFLYNQNCSHIIKVILDYYKCKNREKKTRHAFKINVYLVSFKNDVI